jgi:hypothetical protein
VSEYTDVHGINSPCESRVCHGSEVDCSKKEHLFSNKDLFSHEHGINSWHLLMRQNGLYRTIWRCKIDLSIVWRTNVKD